MKKQHKKRWMKPLLTVVFFIGILNSVGCASIFSQSRYPVNINSDPPGASVTIKNMSGRQIHKATTPTVVVLSASDGFFRSAKYSILYEKEGYEPFTQIFSANLDGWYAGNIIWGASSVFGFLIIDPATGAMWKLPDYANGNLRPAFDDSNKE